MQGTYELTGNNNFVEYLKSLGIADEQTVNFLANAKSTLTVSVDGGKYNIVTDYGAGNTKTISFTPGESFEEEVLKGVKSNSVGTVAGDKITINQSAADGSTASRVYDFSGGKLVITLTSSLTSETATRSYKKL